MKRGDGSDITAANGLLATVQCSDAACWAASLSGVGCAPLNHQPPTSDPASPPPRTGRGQAEVLLPATRHSPGFTRRPSPAGHGGSVPASLRPHVTCSADPFP